MKTRWIAGAAVTSALIGFGPAWAEEQTLKFRLVTMPIEETVLQVANLPGQTVGTNKEAGVAVFEDGRIAYKNYVVSFDDTEKSGSFGGYSTYTFANGDSITAKFTGGWSDQGLAGDYEVLSGTGAYEGVTGTGHFDGVEEAWEGANLLEGSFTLEVPGS